MAERQDRDAAEEAARTAEELARTADEAASGAAEAAAQAREISEGLMGYADLLNSPSEIVYLLGIFVLAIFVGYYVVWSVTPALHTPLMSVTNAISSVVVVGALIALGADLTQSAAGMWPKAFGFIAVALASVNIVGGFMVTQRMLEMYKKKER